MNASSRAAERLAVCVVLAAGYSRRLRTRHGPKPLVPLLGLTLLERTVLNAAEAGLRVFHVVTGFDAERVERHCADLARRHDLTVVPVRSEQWRAGNGASALAARELCREDFVLLMADHVFDPAVVRQLLECGAPGDLLASVDCRTGARRDFEPRDATKLLLEDDRIIAIGKDLPKFNAYDTGMFSCSPAVFPALEASIREGDASLAGGIRRLAERGRARAVEIGDRRWIDIDTRRQLRQARTLLLQDVGKADDGVIARRINRPVSTHLVTPFLLRAFPCITPIQVSVLGLLAGVLASILFSVGWPVVAGVAAMLASVLDGSDGEIARLKKAASSLGRYFDAVLDRYADALILVGAGAYAWSHPITEATSLATWHVIVVIVAALALVGHLMVSYTSARALVDLGHAYRGRLIQAGRGRDLRLFVVSIGGILTLINPVSVLIALVVVAGLANATVVGRLWVSWRRVRRAAPDVTAVIFDLDGTLADTMPFLTTIAIEALKRRGLPPERARQRYLASVGLDFAGQLEEIFPLDPANEGTAADFEAEKRAGIASSGLIPGALELLAFLSGRGIRCFTVSSTSHEVVAGYLAHTGLDANLDDWTAFGPGFDKHAQVASLLRTHDLDPRRVLFVADAPRDFELVRSSLVGFVGVRSTFGAKPFRDLGLDSVADLKELRSRWARSEPLEATSTPGAGRSAAAP